MQTFENESALIPFPSPEERQPPVADTEGRYENVRFNAMKHGILSKLAVLAHEDHAEFDDLLAALIGLEFLGSLRV